MTTATATITYRKTKAGEWVAYGPAVMRNERRPLRRRAHPGSVGERWAAIRRG